METAGQQIVLIERGFLREPSLETALEDLEYRGLEECFEGFWDRVKEGDPASVVPVVGEILDAAHPHLVQLRLRGKRERLALAIPWNRIRGIGALTEPQRTKLVVRVTGQF